VIKEITVIVEACYFCQQHAKFYAMFCSQD